MTTPDPLLGIEIGRYRIERLLGQGGMGAVYLGVHPAIGSLVAIKVLSAECARSPELLERFFAEARSVNVIRHESIASVIDLAQLPDGRPYIVMEFIEGRTLGDMVRAGTPLPIGGIVQVITEMLSALAAAHERGIIHRDLKPDNIIVTREGHAKVLDFGIAKLAPGLSANSPRTATGALLGTPAYMAPEQISGAQNVDARTDIYAAGVVLFECITGAPPFKGETLFDLMRAHLELAPPSPTQLRPELPAPLADVILIALAKDPARRFQSASAMAEALRHAATSLPGEQWRTLSGKVLTGRPSLQHAKQPTPVELARHATPVPVEPTQAPRRSRTGLVVAVGAVAAAIVVVAVVATRAPSTSPGPVAPPTPVVVATEPVGTPGDAALAEAPPAERIGRASAPPIDARPPDRVTAPVIDTPRPPPPEPVKVINAAVVIGTPVPEDKLLREPASYNAKQFDGKGFAPRALALARAQIADVGFVRMDLEGIQPNGMIDLTSGVEPEYEFRSPSKQGECYVRVTVRAKQAIARVMENSSDAKCKAPLRTFPRCAIAQVWAQAVAEATSDNRPIEAPVKISFLTDGAWYFSSEGWSGTIEDRCP